MIVVAKVTNAGGACPFQVEGVTDKGEEVYARYRWGNLRVEVNREIVYRWRKKEEPETDEERIASYRAAGMTEEVIEKMESSHKMMKDFCQGPMSYDGHMTYEELREITEGVIQWPDNIEGE